MKKVGFYTLGCKVNQYETQVMMEKFKEAGYEIVNFDQIADVYVINTCTVTSISDKKSRQVIRHAQRTNPLAIIAVVGCYSQIAHEEIEKIEGVDIIVGVKEKTKILELVESVEKGKKIKCISNVMKLRDFEENEIISYSERTRAVIKIQDGCDRFCSYCIIPYARGPVRSRNKESILEEVKRLVNNGFKEIVLTGIHLSSYGKDLKDISLIDVIEEVSKVPGVKRIRLGSLEPTTISKEFVDRIKKIENFCPHFHISLQSGSDSVLKRMNRKYTAKDFEYKVEILKNNISDVSITTDIIVGFPGETDEEFIETYNFLKKLPLTRMHVFKYSPRKGTPAAAYPEQVDPRIKEERSNILLELSNEKEREFNAKFIGMVREVLFEKKSSLGEGYMEGHTDNFILVAAKTNNDTIGEFKQVRLLKIENNGVVRGEIFNG